ncbi:epoxide hydrolase [Rhodococcus sp. BP-252]|uniref:Epoxide hydrolase n=1 Tax=Rhodococcoides kyotonense TaxID=398843 RepID=A0A177YFI5_9NOCA|nr:MULTISPECIES: epoxide hydrolase family protein [Rhodococcus]MBY6409986.1 epoxide hydrolase [Rhodococcus sp. BP-320]MBY6414954.1 epoxide hydrolase [Rhodococcus sp. BP-321]MBY6421342.1 epoxide hydrolase [Rhodococcus sp. BP-324]MBY6425738.1 epoxide hydrolase [Rhodococcus sp. BP-323]MBY6429850.1 epoxide hydrolase [Rhodococcus sp. BP-322]
MTSFKASPFRVDIPQAELDDLRRRLTGTRWPDDLPGVGWEYGVPVTYLRELAEYWATAFDWRAHEKRLNRYPQFVADIDGRTLHYVHVASPDPDAVPLVLVHGWPFEDFGDVIGPLTDPRGHGDDTAQAFHVVVPTLPGFGFSGPTTRRGDADTVCSAELIARLMAELGYDRYGAQGGDAGSFIAPQLGRIAPDKVIGVHMNGPITIPSWDDDGSGYSAEDRKKVAALADWSNSETASYASVHSTRPATLAPALTDSPVGLLSWVIDVVNTYIDPAKTLSDAIDRDMLLANVSILWFTETIGSSMRLYKESTQWGAELTSSGVPTAAAVFARDNSIRGIAEKQNHIVRWTEFDHGGHFAAMETPGELIDDLRTFFSSLSR